MESDNDRASVDGPSMREVAEDIVIRTSTVIDGAIIVAAAIIRPNLGNADVISTNERGALASALRVVVDARNDRLWRDLTAGELVLVSANSLPEVVRTAAEKAGMAAAHVVRFDGDDSIDCILLWFVSDADLADAGGAGHADRVDAIAQIDSALERERSAPDDDADDRDELTGLVNRTAFDRALEELEVDEATVLVLDLDDFTQVNEQFGRDAGDRVLIEVARRLESACRKSDVIARLDGDQYGVLLTGTDRSTALVVSKRLLSTVSDPLPTDIGPESVTATVGLAHQIGLLDTEELLESADSAMTSGKRNGPGRVIIAT